MVAKLALVLTCTRYWTLELLPADALQDMGTVQDEEQTAGITVLMTGTVGAVGAVPAFTHGVFTFHFWVVSFPSWQEPTLGDGLTAGASLESVLYPPRSPTLPPAQKPGILPDPLPSLPEPLPEVMAPVLLGICPRWGASRQLVTMSRGRLALCGAWHLEQE